MVDVVELGERGGRMMSKRVGEVVDVESVGRGLWAEGCTKLGSGRLHEYNVFTYPKI